MLYQPKHVQAASKRLNQTFRALGAKVVGRADILERIKYALVTKHHVLLEGPPGTAKSYLAMSVFSAIQDAEHFKVACTKKMSEDYLVGPLDMKLFREEGEYFHRVGGYLPTAQYAFLDEFLDLSQGALRALLEVLNERRFSRGPQQVKCPLHTCIAATNFSSESEVALAAVSDRFLFRAKVAPLSARDRRKMLSRPKVVVPTTTHQDIATLYQACLSVRIPDNVLDGYAAVASGIPKLTDRTAMRCLMVVKASAVLRGATIAEVRDLGALEYCWSVSGDGASESEFGKALSPIMDGYHSSKDILLSASLVEQRANDLVKLAKAATTYNDIQVVAVEAREVQATVPFLTLKVSQQHHGYAKIVAMLDRAKLYCHQVTELANDLYIKENSK